MVWSTITPTSALLAGTDREFNSSSATINFPFFVFDVSFAKSRNGKNVRSI